ncbi:hypothetical protein TDB9533_00542 [Thalassocella blandensis]|nr:hypothetical protein TDB9533_00542 [Thalassocella blandensis]
MNDDYIEKLLKGANKPPTPNSNDAQEILVATKKAWQESVRQNKSREKKRKVIAFNFAAIVLVGILGLWKFQPFNSANDLKELGSITFASNLYQINGNKQSAPSRIHSGDTLTAGSSTLLSVTLQDGTLITFAPDTALQFTGVSTMNLMTGRIFVDSPGQNTSVVIGTPWGSIQDIGTQFEITVDTNELTVAMREGKVKMDLGHSIEYAAYENGKGDLIRINKANQMRKEEISSTDTHWSWTIPAIKALNLENITAYDLLNWVSRTTGRNIVYNSALVSQLAKETHFSTGRIEADAIDPVLPVLFETTTLSLKIDNNTITVSENK